MMTHFNRFTASGLHLAISVIIALAVLIGMKLVWYPAPYFQAIDAGGLILILVGVDVVMGPLITLIVFNRKKPELKRDLIIVAALQLAALVYGMHVVFVARPAYAVFNVNRFDLVVASEIDPGEMKKASRPEFQSLPWLGPQIIAAKLPSNKQESETILFSAVAGGADVFHLPRYYVPYSEVMDQAKTKAKPLATLRNKPDANELVDRFLARHGYSESQLGFVPFHGRKRDAVFVLELATGKVVGHLPVDPF